MAKKIERPAKAITTEASKIDEPAVPTAAATTDVSETTELQTAEDEPKISTAKDDKPLKDTLVESAETDEDVEVTPLNISSSGQVPAHHHLWHALKAHKGLSITLVVLLAVMVLAAIPYTRYILAGTVIRKDFKVVVIDSQTNKPVTSATVRLSGVSATTDSQGRATIHSNVGNATISVTKKYYKDAAASVLIPFKQKQPYNLTLVATGRQVPVTVVNKIGGKAVANAKITADNSEALTDEKGEATIVLPANSKEVKGSILADNYNKSEVTIKITASKDDANTFSITPRGKLYFLSNASGNIDVVKSDLDGKNRQTVVDGTGKEDRANTILFASTDWKYLALLSKRDSSQPKLHLIETDTDKMTTMDEGDATFTMVGWNGHQFVYKVSRTSVKNWQPKQEALKSFDAETKKLATLDETTAEGSADYSYLREYIGGVFILDGETVYSKNWGANGFYAPEKNKQATLNSVKQSASSRRTVKSFSRSDASFPVIDIRPYGPNDLYIQHYDGSRYVYYEYEDGKIDEEKGLTDNAYYSAYPTYLISPDAQRTFWNDSRDGKNALLVGDKSAKNPKQVGLLKDYNAYGRYTDKYLLLSKDGSELYIIPDEGLAEGEQPSKVSDYYRPNIYYGYGRGYGGL